MQRCIKLIRRFVDISEDDEHDTKARAYQYDTFGEQLTSALRRVGNEALATLNDAFQWQVTEVLQTSDEEMNDDGTIDSDEVIQHSPASTTDDSQSDAEEENDDDENSDSTDTSMDNDSDTSNSSTSTSDDDEEDKRARFVKFEQLLVTYLQDFKIDLKGECENDDDEWQFDGRISIPHLRSIRCTTTLRP